MVKKIILGLVLAFLIIQVFRPKKNLSSDTNKDISTLYNVPDDVKTILRKSCNDCHSNKTEYPWYAELEPVGWWLNDHIIDGKRHFNLNNFASLRVAVQKKKLEELVDQIRGNDMPIGSYTLIHRSAELSEADKQKMYAWSNGIINSIKAKYPPDSLVLKREKRRD